MNVARAIVTKTFQKFDTFLAPRASSSRLDARHLDASLEPIVSRRLASRDVRGRASGPRDSRVGAPSHLDRHVPRRRASAPRLARDGVTAARVDGGDARDVSRAARGAVSTIRGVSATRDVRGETTVLLRRAGRRAAKADVVDGGERAGGDVERSDEDDGDDAEKRDDDRAADGDGGVGEFFLHRVRRREDAVSVDATVSRDASARGGDAESGRDVCVESVVVLFEFFWSGWGVSAHARERRVERRRGDEERVRERHERRSRVRERA